jgi:hypothetical protein
LQEVGLLDVEDAETGEFITVDTSSGFFKQGFHKNQVQWLKNREQILKSSGIARINLSTRGDYAKPIMEFFERQKRSR